MVLLHLNISRVAVSQGYQLSPLRFYLFGFLTVLRTEPRPALLSYIPSYLLICLFVSL